MKQHHWTNPLLSMLASTAMCAILSFNQPEMHSSDNDKLAYQANSFETIHSQAELKLRQEKKYQLELALTLELFAEEQKMLKAKVEQINLSRQQSSDKQACDKRSLRSVKTQYIMPMVRNTNSI